MAEQSEFLPEMPERHMLHVSYNNVSTKRVLKPKILIHKYC